MRPSLAEFHDIAILQHMVLDALAVDPGAIGAFQIVEHIPAFFQANLGMLAGRTDVLFGIKRDIIFRMPTQRNHFRFRKIQGFPFPGAGNKNQFDFHEIVPLRKYVIYLLMG